MTSLPTKPWLLRKRFSSAASEASSLARRATDARPGEETFCSFAFDLTAFARARSWIEGDVEGCDVIVIDEVSRLEAAGRGHADAIVDALASGRLVVLSVRADQAFDVLSRFALEEPAAALELARSPSLDVFVPALVAAVRG